jgi:hypothetical protein
VFRNCRASTSEGSADEFEHLARLRVPAELGFLEHCLAVNGHLEPAAAAGLQRHLGLGKRLTNRGRQTDGPWFVVSDAAEFDIDAHYTSRAGEI